MSSTTSQPALKLSRDDLHGYQQRAIDYVKSNPSCALWVDMGLGKTAATLTAIADLLDAFETSRILIVGPLRVVKLTWPEEIAKWSHTQHLDYAVAVGSVKERLAAIAQNKTITLINRENFAWLSKQFKREEWPYDLVVWDESSDLKDRSAKRTNAALKLARPQRRYRLEKLPNGKKKRIELPPGPPAIDRFVELTGTPASNGLEGLWSQISILDDGQRLGRTLTQFRDRYFDYNPYRRTWDLREGSEDEIHKKVADICLVLTADDYLDLPELISVEVPVELPSKVRQIYDELEQEFCAEIGGETIVVEFEAGLGNKLLQIANGILYTNKQKDWTALHDAKLDALADLVESNAGEPMLVGYSFIPDAERIIERFPQAVLVGQDDDVFAQWNRGEIPLLVSHPASIGHGLNLQYGGHHIVWYGITWSLELYLQFNARLRRQDQSKPVIAHHITAQDTLDPVVHMALSNKNVTEKSLKAAVTEYARQRMAA